ncbi:HRDC-like protein [Pestalotiopsis sp. NC0098]|nr:HRDC-like protein [Pestalotiopsis sp. NC0098]
MASQSNGVRRTNNQQTSRTKPVPAGNEEASAVLNLGEFQDVDTLTLSEASLVINALVNKRRVEGKDVDKNEMLTKTMDYLDNFARFQKKENVEAVERLLSAHKEFHKFERAQLGTLCCADADEAKTLIPSLTDKISDEDLTELLEEMQKFR